MAMRHVEALAERILFLKGDVEMVPAGPVEKIVAPEAVLVKAMAMEEDGIRTYNEAAFASLDGDPQALHEREAQVTAAKGRIVAMDAPARLKSQYGGPGATLEDVFIQLTGKEFQQ